MTIIIIIIIIQIDNVIIVGSLVVSVLAIGPKVREFKPDRSRCIFNGDKNPQRDFFRRGSKDVGPMS
jgi:hypothetical protein